MSDRPDDTDLLALLKASYTDAAAYSDDVLAPERKRAFDYYLGDVYKRDGRPETLEDVEGQTSIVMREVADIVHMMLPGIVRIFTGGEEVVSFDPRGPDDEAGAQQRTDYVNFLVAADGNNWFVTLHDAVHDALLKKTGVIKWWWDERVQIDEQDYTDLTPIQAALMRADPEVEVLEETVRPDPSMPAPPEAAQQPMMEGMAPAAPQAQQTDPALPGAAPPQTDAAGATLHDIRIRRTRTKKVLRVGAVPPEEFLLARDARDVPTTPYCAHRRLITVSDLVAEGFPREVVEDHAKPDLASFADLNGEAEQRSPGLTDARGGGTTPRSMWSVFHVEHYVRYDADGDGIAELHRVRTIGENSETILHDEIVPEPPFAIGSPIRMPHAAVGMSIADQTGDLQDIKTSIMRSTLDSLAQAIFPAMGVVENAVEMPDVLSKELGRIIRMKAPGMVQPLAEPFVGPQALGVMQYIDQVRGERTGITPQSAQLDSKAMQSTTRVAVENTVERSQERVEMIARTLAETLIRDTFRGVLREVVRNQDKPRVVRLRGQWVEVDPRAWDTDADVIVNVGLGRGTDMQRLQFLTTVAEKQEQIIMQMGPGNPMVAPSQLRATYAEMMRLAGFKDSKKFFKEITPQQDEQMAQVAAQAPKPQDPAMVMAEIEKMKAQSDIQIAQMKAQTDMLKAQAEDDRERDRMMIDAILRAAEIEAKTGAQVNMAALKAEVQREQSAFQAAQRQREAEAAHERDILKHQTSVASNERIAQQRAQQRPNGALQ